MFDLFCLFHYLTTESDIHLFAIAGRTAETNWIHFLTWATPGTLVRNTYI